MAAAAAGAAGAGAEAPPPPAGVRVNTLESPRELAEVMRLVEKDLSEPYSVFTYRYFALNWPGLTLVARGEAEAAEGSVAPLLGVVVCKVDRANRRKRLRGYIAMLAVEESQRKRGIGRYLVQRVIRTMRDEMRCDEVVLETEMSNKTALAFYERLGFVRDKRLIKYYLNAGDAVRLKLWFTPPSWAEDAAALLGDKDKEDAPTEATAGVAVDVAGAEEEEEEEVSNSKAASEPAAKKSPKKKKTTNKT